jgi:glucose/arabinose dehydrogenase
MTGLPDGAFETVRRYSLLAVAVGIAVACADGDSTHNPHAGASGQNAGEGGRADPRGGSSGLGGGGADGGAADAGGASGSSAGGSDAGSGASAGSSGHDGGAPSNALAPSCAAPEGERSSLALTAIARVNDPVQIVAPPNDPRLFVVSRSGKVFIVSEGEVLEKPFIEIEVEGKYAERGLLGLAFHPDYAENGLFYLYGTPPPPPDPEPAEVMLAEYRVSDDDPNVAEPAPTRTLLRIPQPEGKHKAGTLAFDSLGLLYVAVGNGGLPAASGDPMDLKGKILRLDPAIDDDGYRIPDENPRLAGWAPEVLEMGLRNPWRIAIDPCTDDLYIGDVGNTSFEEIDVSPAHRRGNHFGFPLREGDVDTCERYAVEKCETAGLTRHITGFDRGGGCAIIGGAVYRGHEIPSLRGSYLYADYCSGRFHAIRYERGALVSQEEITEDLNPDGIESISSFGVDARGELYVASRDTNEIYRIDPE